MEANSFVLKLVVKECCRSLSYNDEERQFSFPLQPSLRDFWERHKDTIKSQVPDFTLSDFNHLLSQLESPISYPKISFFSSLCDGEILNGEVIYLKTESRELYLVKMKAGQYLSVTDGKGLSFGEQVEFRKGNELVTSENIGYGKIKETGIVMPHPYSIFLSRIFIGKYYLCGIAESLWPVYDTAVSYLMEPRKKAIEAITDSCLESGIGAHSLLYILKGVCSAS